jgi:hypothetical protein
MELVEEFVKNTGEIWYFKIVSGAVAADVSRLPVIPSIFCSQDK